MARIGRLVAVGCTVALVVAACGDDGGSDAAPGDGTEAQVDEGVDDTDDTDDTADDATDDTAGATPDDGGVEPGPTDGASGAPGSPVVASMQQFYGDDPDAALGFDAFLVNAYWFAGADGFRVVQFHPLEPSLFANVCPGASAAVGADFQHVANADTGGSACDGFDTLVGGDVAAYDCDGVLTLRTAIPNDFVSDALYASMETAAGGDSVQGYSSVATPGGEPELDVSGCTALV